MKKNIKIQGESMTNFERIKRRIPDEPDEGLLKEMLDSAKNVILGRRFPYGDWPTIFVEDEDGNHVEVTVVEPRYQDLQIRIAEDMYNRLGAQGQLSHSENGISRSWGAEWVSEQLLQEITPMVGVV